MKFFFFIWLAIFNSGLSVSKTTTSLKLNGSTTVNPVITEASEYFRKKGWRVLVDTQGGSSGGISYLAEGLADIGMISRPVTNSDRKKFPTTNFVEHIIGYDGVALVVSKDLHKSGVKSLTKSQIRKIYESKVTNWKDVGGPDRRIVFFNKEAGRGTWEVFAKYIYDGKIKQAPKVFHPEVGSNQEARTKVGHHKGSITQLSASWAWQSDAVEAISITTSGGQAIPATRETIASNHYPLRRPLILITKGKPNAKTQEFIDYILSKEGQKIVTKHGYLNLGN